MLNRKAVIALILLCGAIFFMAGCYKDKTVITAAPEITRTVSFSQDIIPVFTKSCALTGCHNSNGQVPDLTSNNAYRAINQQDLINVAEPENSEIYGWLTGKIKPAMPLGGPANPSNIDALILAWIKQGAKNN